MYFANVASPVFFVVLSLSVAMIRATMRRGTDPRGHMRDLQILSADRVAVVFE